MAHNHGFLTAIGGLVVNWANNESVFLAMLQCLTKLDGPAVSVLWHSHRTSKGRLDVNARLSRQLLQDKALIADIEDVISKFSGFSRARNFFCHATYDYGPDLSLRSASSSTLANEGEPIRHETKRMDLATLNEINQASIRLAEFNRVLWGVVRRMEAALGVRRSMPLGGPSDNPLPEVPPPPTETAP